MELTRETAYTKTPKQPNLIVVDSIMGSGKTSWAIQHMNNADNEMKFIYITPFLKEVERVNTSVTNRKFHEPKQDKGKGKMYNLKELIASGKNIVSTHALFQNADEELIELIRISNYSLILDEAMNVVDYFPLGRDDFRLLIHGNMVAIEEGTGLVRWNDNSEYQETKYEDIKNLAKSENLYFYDDTMLYWTFPVSAFVAFEEIYVLTFLFQAQQQKYYYDMYNLDYSYKSVQKTGEFYELINYADKKSDDINHLRSLITIYEGRLNNIGDDYYALSHSWFYKKDNAPFVTRLQKNILSYFKNNVKTLSASNMWTCFKDNNVSVKKGKETGFISLRGKGYTSGFVPCNARATNEFKNKESLAYLVNRFVNPYEIRFFQSLGITMNLDDYALAELLQWIWRSRIREGLPINLYIPSSRMRNLLIKFLNKEMQI